MSDSQVVLKGLLGGIVGFFCIVANIDWIFPPVRYTGGVTWIYILHAGAILGAVTGNMYGIIKLKERGSIVPAVLISSTSVIVHLNLLWISIFWSASFWGPRPIPEHANLVNTIIYWAPGLTWSIVLMYVGLHYLAKKAEITE